MKSRRHRKIWRLQGYKKKDRYIYERESICPRCNGKGEHPDNRVNDFFEVESDIYDCLLCDGTGRYIEVQTTI